MYNNIKRYRETLGPDGLSSDLPTGDTCCYMIEMSQLNQYLAIEL